jgi:hypothetical protein
VDSATAGVDRLSDALVLSNHERDDLLAMLRVHRTLITAWEGLDVAARKRLAAGPGFDRGLVLLETESPDRAGGIRRAVEELAATGLAPSPLISGDDLLAAGLRPGPAFREILDAVYDAQLEGRLSDREEALRMAVAWNVKSP